METAETTLFPYIFDIISKKPDLCASAESLYQEIKQNLSGDRVYRGTELKHSVYFAIELAAKLGIVVVSDEECIMPYNFRTPYKADEPNIDCTPYTNDDDSVISDNNDDDILFHPKGKKKTPCKKKRLRKSRWMKKTMRTPFYKSNQRKTNKKKRIKRVPVKFMPKITRVQRKRPVVRPCPRRNLPQTDNELDDQASSTLASGLSKMRNFMKGLSLKRPLSPANENESSNEYLAPPCKRLCRRYSSGDIHSSSSESSIQDISKQQDRYPGNAWSRNKNPNDNSQRLSNVGRAKAKLSQPRKNQEEATTSGAVKKKPGAKKLQKKQELELGSSESSLNENPQSTRFMRKPQKNSLESGITNSNASRKQSVLPPKWYSSSSECSIGELPQTNSKLIQKLQTESLAAARSYLTDSLNQAKTPRKSKRNQKLQSNRSHSLVNEQLQSNNKLKRKRKATSDENLTSGSKNAPKRARFAQKNTNPSCLQVSLMDKLINAKKKCLQDPPREVVYPSSSDSQMSIDDRKRLYKQMPQKRNNRGDSMSHNYKNSTLRSPPTLNRDREEHLQTPRMRNKETRTGKRPHKKR